MHGGPNLLLRLRESFAVHYPFHVYIGQPGNMSHVWTGDLRREGKLIRLQLTIVNAHH